MSRLGDDPVLIGDGWPGPARALVDIHVDHVRPVELVALLAEVVDSDEFDVLSLGPPLRLQLPIPALRDVMDAVEYQRIKILQWPYSVGPGLTP